MRSLTYGSSDPKFWHAGRGRTMRSEAGMSLAEITVVMVLMSIVVVAAATYSVPWLGREDMRGAIYQAQEFMQLARAQAITRNRDCQFRIDTASRMVSVVDLNDPSTSADDITLNTATLSSRITFARPDSGSAVTLASVSGSLYQATFASNGSVASGAGLVSVQGGDGNYRINLFAAGGVRVERWDGSSWVAGS